MESHSLRTIDGDAALRDARRLSFARFPGTEEEARARRIISDGLRHLGYSVEEHSFRYDSFPADLLRRLSPLLPVALIGGFALLLPRVSILEWLALTVGLPMALLLLRRPWLERLFDGDREASANLLARRPCGNAGTARPVILFVAHVDSKSQALSLVLRSLLATTLLISSAVGWLLIGLDAAAFRIGAPFSLVAICLVLAGCGLPLALNRNGNDSPGALDDAAGCGVLMELARVVKDAPDLPYEPVFAFTGAEEVGMVGAARLARQLGGEKTEAWRFVNFDGPGAGCGLLALTHGPAGRKVASAARSASSDCGVPIRFARLIPAAGVDGVPLGARGLSGVTLLSASTGPAVRAVHRPGDRWENLEPRALEAAGRLALALAHRLSDESFS